MTKRHDHQSVSKGIRPDRIELFRGLPAEDFQQLATRFHQHAVRAGTTLMMAGQLGEAVHFILDGTVRVNVEQMDGADVLISILGPGEVVGEMSLLDNTSRSASVVTIEKTRLLSLDRESFRRCLHTIPALSFNLACVLAARLRRANQQIQVLAALDVECRVAWRLLAFAEQYGQVLHNGDLLIPIRLTQSDIASMVGASREHTNKVLVSYKERGYVSTDPHYHFTVHDQQALARRCQHVYQPASAIL